MVVIRNVTNQHAAVCQVLAFLMATASQLEHVGHLMLVGHVGCEVLRPFSTTGAKFCAPSVPRGAKFRETSAPRDTILLDPPPSFKAPTLTGTVPELPFPHENPISLTEIQILHESYAGHMIYYTAHGTHGHTDHTARTSQPSRPSPHTTNAHGPWSWAQTCRRYFAFCTNFSPNLY